MLHVLLLPLLLLLPPLASGWSRYEQPIRLQSARDGKAVDWELRVEHLLTMSVERENLGLAILDYQPAKMAWLEREKNQLKGCLDHKTLFSITNNHSTADWSLHGEAALPDLIQLHGRHQRLWAVNGQIPGPTLILPEGAQVRIRLKNRLLLDSLGLNLHGLRLQGQWFHGGVAPLQQCPLTVRSDLDFLFVAEPAGTHWYHGQFPDGHQSNGLLGPLVVLPADGVSEDRDYVALLQDWPWVGTEERAQSWREGSAQWATGAHGDFDGPSAEGANPDDGVWAILVNQKGWHDRHDIRHRPHRIPWTRFAVGKDEHVRIRLIHGGFSHPMSVHFEGHAMEVVAADGADLKPEKVDALIIFPGERLAIHPFESHSYILDSHSYDVRLHTLGRPTRSLYRMVIGLAEQFLSKSAAIREPIYGLAELDFGLGKEEEGEKVDFLLQKCLAKECAILGCPFSSANSTFKTGDGRKFRCIPADRLEKIGEKAGGNRTEEDVVEKHVIAIDPLAQTVDGFQFRMANASFGPFFLAGAAEKALALADGNCSKCESSPCQCFYHKRFTLGRTVQITFAHSQKPESTADNGNSSMSFPSLDLWRHSFSIHLHGTKFKVIKIGLPQMDSRGMAASNSQLEKCLSAKECNHFGAKVEMNGRELEKDTVMVPFGGYTIIRFRAGNPGWWLAETQQKGQRPITRFAFAIGTEEQMPKPPRGFPSDCGTFDPGADIYKQFVFE